MQRIIETDRTYRIPSKDGYDLVQVLSVGDTTLKVKNFSTDKTYSTPKAEFQSKLDSGQIYVSSALRDSVLAALSAITADASLSEIRRIAQKFASEFFPDLELPKFKIVNQQRSTWLGKTYGKWNPDGTVESEIKLQKSILDDKETLERIIAHELIHAWQYQTIPFEQLKRTDGHGSFFQEWADKINAKYGADYVTTTSDLSYVIKQKAKPYVLILRNSPKGLLANSMIRPSKKQKENIKMLIERAGAVVVKTDDVRFMDAPTVTSNKVMPIPDELAGTAQELFEGPNDNDKYL